MTKVLTHRIPVALGTSLAAIAGTMAMSLALAQPQPYQGPEVTVQGGRLTQQVVGQTYLGAPVVQVQLSRAVYTADLNLNTQAGMSVLKHRIRYTARETCQQLHDQYGVGNLEPWVTSNAGCVGSAIRNAMAQVPALVAAANTSHRYE